MKTEQIDTVEDEKNEKKLDEIFANFYERFVTFLEEDDICDYFRVPAPILAEHALDDMINLSSTLSNFRHYIFNVEESNENENEEISEPTTTLNKEIKKHLH